MSGEISVNFKQKIAKMYYFLGFKVYFLFFTSIERKGGGLAGRGSKPSECCVVIIIRDNEIHKNK